MTRLEGEWYLFREDAARWIVPEAVGDPDELTPKLILRLLWQYPPLRAAAWFRFAAWLRRRGVRGVPLLIQQRLLLRHGLEIDPRTPVGGGLYIGHTVGCALNAERIGRNVTIIGATTFGVRGDAAAPRVGDGAFIGIGARILGDIDVGAGARIGANAVVLGDVPAGVTAVGVPARLLS